LAETLINDKWHWYSMMADLEQQGRLVGVVINPLTVDTNSCGGEFRNVRFFVTWVHDRFMLLTMSEMSEELVEAFASVLEYRPFCKYQDVNDLPTVEWSKVDPEERLAELQTNGVVALEKAA